MSLESDVRDYAVLFGDAIAAAEAGGYRVVWPANAAGLASIAISETSKVSQAVVTEIVVDADTSGAEQFAKAMDEAVVSTPKPRAGRAKPAT